MIKEDIKNAIREANKQARMWEQEANMAEDELREAEEKCQEYYDIIDALEKGLKADDQS